MVRLESVAPAPKPTVVQMQHVKLTTFVWGEVSAVGSLIGFRITRSFAMTSSIVGTKTVVRSP